MQVVLLFSLNLVLGLQQLSVVSRNRGHIQIRRKVEDSTILIVSRASSSDAEELRKQAAQLREEADMLEKSMAEERAAVMEKELSDFFSEADTNKDGVVSLEELRIALRKKLVEENENPRSADRYQQVLASEERVRQILQDLDTNADGVLQRDEIISISGFKDRLEKIFREGKRASLAITNRDAVQAATKERLIMLDAVANSTNITYRLGAALCYVLPFLDAIPIEILTQLPPNPISVAAVSAAIGFKTFPASGLILFFALSAVASNAGVPRLTRFAARHAVILDLCAALLLPLVYQFVIPPYSLATAIVFEAVVIVCVAAAFLGKDADFIPGTGTLSKRFTDEFDDALRNIVSASSAAEFGLFIADSLNSTSATSSNKTSSFTKTGTDNEKRNTDGGDSSSS